MKTTVFAFAALAAFAFSGAAFAGDSKGPIAMSDAEMDGVTAAGPAGTPGEGRLTAGKTLLMNPNGKYVGGGKTTAPGQNK